ncbi:hypothetical protein [Halosimplex salinum]|uniref:hypothetical protein n=1 Tax=Halosimplex salinum TaxID=1710538 RepID=UPI000F46E3E8|nr:hypothetical protein [Halosimplex salinum]
MSGERNTPRESQITSDTDTIRDWGKTHEVSPVRYEEEGETRHSLVRESDIDDRHERLDWDEFDTHMRDNDMVVVRHEEGDGEFDVIDRTEVVGHAAITDEDVEERLLEGETVRSEFTERSVVERTIVEEMTVESEVTDRELVESDTVDVELISRDVEDCRVTDVDTTDPGLEALDTFGTSARSEVDCDVEVTIDEAWTVTKENIERVTIESRIVESNVEETDTLETDTIRETVDLEGVERTVLEGELVDSPHTAEQAVERGHVESQFGEDDTIFTHLMRTQVVEEELSVRRLVTGEVSDAETLTSETISHVAVESDIVDPDEHDVDLAAEDLTTTSEARPASGEESAADVDYETAETSETVRPTEDEKGKTVVNASGDEVGMVTAVEGGQMYVDPHPSITDRIRTALGWGAGDDDDTYPVDNDHVARIEEDQVVLGVDREG